MRPNELVQTLVLADDQGHVFRLEERVAEGGHEGLVGWLVGCGCGWLIYIYICVCVGEGGGDYGWGKEGGSSLLGVMCRLCVWAGVGESQFKQRVG
jgi:hypothetical protein